MDGEDPKKIFEKRSRLMQSPERLRSSSFTNVEELKGQKKRKINPSESEAHDFLSELVELVDFLKELCVKPDVPHTVRFEVSRVVHCTRKLAEEREMQMKEKKLAVAKDVMRPQASCSTQTEGRNLHVWGKAVVTFEEGAEITLKKAGVRAQRVPESERGAGPEVDKLETEWQEVGRKGRKKKVSRMEQAGHEGGSADGGVNSKTVQTKKPLVPSVTVRAEGRSYADMLAQLKQQLKPGDLGGVVRSIRRSGDNGMRIEMEKPPADANMMKKALELAIPGAKVANRGVDQAVHVLGMDGGATAEEVLAAAKEALKTHEQAEGLKEVRVTSVRESFLGMKNATIILPRLLAEALAAKGKLLVGFVSCRLRLREDEARCYKCWGKGHMASKCKGKDRSKCCFNCSQPGHTAANCTNAPRCDKCQQEGHRTGARSCKVQEAEGSQTEHGNA